MSLRHNQAEFQNGAFMRQPTATQRCWAAALALGALLISVPARASAADEWTPAGPDGGTILALAVGVPPGAGGAARRPPAPAALPLSEAAGGLWVNAVAVDAGPPETVYASVLLQGLFKSVDGGRSGEHTCELQ